MKDIAASRYCRPGKRAPEMLLLLCALLALSACNRQARIEAAAEAQWLLGWRMIESFWAENYPLAEQQFDSLLSSGQAIESFFMISGLNVKIEQSKQSEVLELLATQARETLELVCTKPFAEGLPPCAELPEEAVENPALQLELIQLFIVDQAARGHVMEDLINRYAIDTSILNIEAAFEVDERNRTRFQAILGAHGFPTRKLVGRDAMQGVFYLIQHADADKDWQKAQLPNLERAIKEGDLARSNYAYLYDRIQVNHGLPQRYGTQFQQVNRQQGIAELHPTEDLPNLNRRRREMGIMPIEMYKRMILKD